MTMTEKHGVDNDAENITLLRQVPCVTITVDAFQVQLTSNRSSVMRYHHSQCIPGPVNFKPQLCHALPSQSMHSRSS